MKKRCNVCSVPLGTPIYESKENSSLTTMNKAITGRTVVFFCDNCSHLQTNELPDVVGFYANEYSVNSGKKNADQIYKINNGKAIFRIEHQADTLKRRVPLDFKTRLLDYGCATADTIRCLIDSGIELQPFLFDVTDRYVDYWKSFPPPTSWSVHEPDQRWYGTMDVLVSFFALEHIPCLRRTLKDMRALLRDGGKLYFVVPNVYSNAADFIVADHVNHFSPLSIEFLLKSQGFSEIEVDAKVHDSAFVVVASKSDYEDTKGTPAPDTSILKEAASGLACFWNESVERIRNFEDSIDAKQFAIYGAGFYGNMIAHNIKNRDRIACFIDRNVNIQRTIFEDIPIYRPEELPANISDLIVGLNPSIARDSIESTVAFKHRKLNCFYL